MNRWTAMIAALSALSCAVETAEPVTDEAIEEPVYDQAPVEAGNNARPGCHPDVVYTIGGALVTVPGYCAQRHFEKPVVGDPDPSFGWEDVSELGDDY